MTVYPLSPLSRRRRLDSGRPALRPHEAGLAQPWSTRVCRDQERRVRSDDGRAPAAVHVPSPCRCHGV